MPARRFFIEGAHGNGDAVSIGGDDAHKIVRVLRLKSGDTIEVIDSTGSLYDASLSVDGQTVIATLQNPREPVRGNAIRVDVAQALPKGQKMDFVVEKLSELGVDAILPFESERCAVRDVGTAKVERWRRIAQSAAQQSGRTNVARIDEPVNYSHVLNRIREYDVALFPWEVAEQRPLRDMLPALVKDAQSILVIVGPEGGFSHDESLRAERASATIISLGTQILRTETAALYVVSVLSYLTS